MTTEVTLPTGGGTLEGPWDQAFWFGVDGTVASKSNHRRGDRTNGRSAWTALASYELSVKTAARQHRPGGWIQGDRAAGVASRPKIVAYIFANTLLDVGNIDKSILDATQGVVMASDAQVCWAANAGVRTKAGGGAVVAFARLAPTSTVAEQAAAGIALAAGVTALLDF